MGKITQKDYETVEKEITKYECDRCGHIGEKNEFVTAALYGQVMEKPAYKHLEATAIVCRECSNQNAAEEMARDLDELGWVQTMKIYAYASGVSAAFMIPLYIFFSYLLSTGSLFFAGLAASILFVIGLAALTGIVGNPNDAEFY